MVDLHCGRHQFCGSHSDLISNNVRALKSEKAGTDNRSVFEVTGNDGSWKELVAYSKAGLRFSLIPAVHLVYTASSRYQSAYPET